LQSVRDIFIFCCYTSLAFVDVKKLKRSEVCIGIDGQLWIQKNRQKSDQGEANTSRAKEYVRLLPTLVAD
jgi:hypothetical protein